MSWWDTRWAARHAIHTRTDGDAYSSGVHFLHVDCDLDGLVSNGLLRADYKDLRVVYQSGTTVSINSPYFIASGRSPHRIFFPAHNEIPRGVDIGGHGSGWGYYLYFGYDDGNTSGLPPEYVNRNFPQAPYSATTTWYKPTGATSGYRDKFLYRLNDDPSIGSPSGFEDATGFTSGLAVYDTGNTSGVIKGQPGRLDLSTEIERSQRCSILAIDGNDGTTVPSGDWCIDFWVYPYATAGTSYWFVKKDNTNSTTTFAWPIKARMIYDATDDGFNSYCTQKRTAFSDTYNQYDKTSTAGIAENEWSHLRFYLGKKYYNAWSCLFCYHNGQRKGITGNCGPPPEPYKTQMESGHCCIGGPVYGFSAEIDGRLEQFRYSTYPWFAQENFNEQNSNSRFCPPDWVDNEYTTYLSNIQLYEPTASGSFGGCTSATTAFVTVSGIFGGYMFGGVLGYGEFGGFAFARLAITSYFGGYTQVARGTVRADFGGFVLGFAPGGGTCVFGAVTSGIGTFVDFGLGGFANAQERTWKSDTMGSNTLSYAGDTQEAFRGYVIGTWTSPDTIVENGSRGLVKSLADTQHRQKFTIDGEVSLYATEEAEFDAAVDIIKREPVGFDSLLMVSRTRKNPFIQVIDTNIAGTGPWTVTITASGYAFDKNNVAIDNAIHNASVDWTDGDYESLPNTTASGEIFKFTHVYTASGLYKPVVSVQDKFGRHGADDTTVNLASGLSLPYIKLLATPRLGTTPPPFYADIGVVLSGVQNPYNLFWNYGNGIRFYNNATSGTAQYALPGDYIPYVRIKDARKIFVVDTLRVGFNQ
jgi:hypothetical protein